MLRCLKLSLHPLRDFRTGLVPDHLPQFTLPVLLKVKSGLGYRHRNTTFRLQLLSRNDTVKFLCVV